MSKTFKASEFKAKCLKIIDNVAESGEPVIITKNGVPVSRLLPYRPPVNTLFGAHAGVVHIEGDIVASIGEFWDAAR